ncbi:hypothetical protein [Candidatus Sulfurimonas baltica]|uniref:Zinc-regulated TonB-dependent outer membrane receptor n=1 Tax=Candidatus Sulfurimonas baltica TaxID=2740404 RepID=A0A7S7LX33_9BACT|nr:hypothetical protein [Candidatus Sulfurimonas baltica]QOY52174.1 hypothetical protein HUE88_00295 [Candidatus Sulfurimonas baltica]
MKKLICLLLVASSFLLADTDFDQLKTQMSKQQLTIQKLEEKIEKLESANLIQEQTPQIQSGAFSQSKFLPDISLIMDASYVNRNKKDSEIGHLEVPGVIHGLLGSHSDGDITHSTYNANSGFNLNYAELAISSAVDPFFTMDAIFHYSQNGVEIEEAYITSTVLGHGLKVKMGKFLSNFGYLTEKHHHLWSFSDMPLVYQSFLGLHAINETGLQLQWTAPTDTYLMVGAEILQGENEQMFGRAALGDEENPIAGESSAPSLFVAYVKSSFDIGDTTIFGGISYASGSSRLDYSGLEEPYVFSGDSSLYGIDLLAKHYLDSYSYISLQGELLMRDMDGVQYDLNATGDVVGNANLRKKQAGFYTQLEYQMNQSYKVGFRYESIYKNDVISDGINQNEANNLDKYSAMLEYRTSEFARFSLQYSRNNALYNEDGVQQSVNTLIFQANIAIGAHGAHSF